MHNKVTWRKGMRLSTEVFNAMDKANCDSLRLVSLLGGANRYGLFPAPKPFDLSVNINGNALEVVSLSCHGITKNGSVVDVDFDSNYTNTFDTRMPIPEGVEGDAFLLILRVHEDKWREVNETFSEQSYSFELIGENSRIDDDCLPVGLIVNQYGWRLNETDFVPPCLYVSAHIKFIEQLERARGLANEAFMKCLTSQDCVAGALLSRVWAASADMMTKLDKERDTLTPGQLYEAVQQFVSAFMIGCFADEYVSLENQDPYALYVQRAYDAKHTWRDIEVGLSLCTEINAKLTAVCSMTAPEPQNAEPAPQQPRQQRAPEPPKPGRRRWEGREI